ncbi:MAG: DUF815 domain-containing protein [Pseudoflavonifractor sp.]|nr:DUF815 domain-containing protein [Pseudoflavonifractor sp.]
MELVTLSYKLRSLIAYRALLEQPVLAAASALLEHLSRGQGEQALDAWASLSCRLGEAGTDGLGSWLLDRLRYCDAPWPKAAESDCSSPILEQSARRDIETLAALAALDSGELRLSLAGLLPPEGRAAAEDLPLWAAGPSFDFDTLTAWYRSHGAGMFARYRAFLWEDNQLLPVPLPDMPKSEELIGYRLQRAQVEANTRSLLTGRLVNNVLLFGDSGTGKSATVKSLLSMPDSEDLRLIEIEKNSVVQMPQLIRSLGGRRQKFILFIDDLAFDQDDQTYGVLKTILEGGLEPRPANVAIYATSNRRNLVRQTFSDRAGDEVDRGETIQEKTALADRFGLRIPYLGLAKAEYLSLVEHLAAQAGTCLPREELFARAVQWDARHPGRSPRTAQQFISSLA